MKESPFCPLCVCSVDSAHVAAEGAELCRILHLLLCSLSFLPENSSPLYRNVQKQMNLNDVCDQLAKILIWILVSFQIKNIHENQRTNLVFWGVIIKERAELIMLAFSSFLPVNLLHKHTHRHNNADTFHCPRWFYVRSMASWSLTLSHPGPSYNSCVCVWGGWLTVRWGLRRWHHIWE